MQENQTVIQELFIMGFQVSHGYKILLFVLFLSVYVITIAGNLLIISLVATCSQLFYPMYFYLSNLSVCEILLTTNISPYMIHLLLVDKSPVSVARCFLQFYFFGTSATTECFLLAVMSYDRYLAICNPLRYSSIMDEKRCHDLALCVWVIGLSATVGTIVLLCKLEFCGPNVIDHFFCDREPILKLSCSDTIMVRAQALVFSFIITLFPFAVILWSYASIILTILRMPTAVVRKKAFSTCSSHLMVVSMYYGTLIIMYVVPTNGQRFNANKLLSLLYTVVTPLLNPIIYSFRNQEIKGSLNEALRRIFCPEKY
ncbi:olfactory receptor 10A7 [Xenopus laevis]|uniref:Olfactory receptor n=2 Tax=Xenopus laevis TaxID=8355 RepID=A0A1L8HPR5_XENLA|nr:olfactory receptor 10A7 [Xenopus laevis]OCT98093.1 hypothetical protein XELAEV_18010321mg [Xenopus laevis]